MTISEGETEYLKHRLDTITKNIDSYTRMIQALKECLDSHLKILGWEPGLQAEASDSALELLSSKIALSELSAIIDDYQGKGENNDQQETPVEGANNRSI